MKYKSICRLLGTLLLLAGLNVYAQGTAFYYQGRLNDNGGPATGNYDLRFALFDAPTNGNAFSVPQTNLAVPVTAGLFATNLDFGKVFAGSNFWMSVGVRTNGDTNGFTLLWPRQIILPVPYAIFATTASNLSGTLSATQLVGTLSSAQVSGTYGGQVNFSNAANNFAGTFIGDGSGLVNLNGSQVTSGTVADARLSGNVALLNANQTYTGTNFFRGVNVFTNRNNAFTGSFFGNGLVGWIPVSGISTQAVADTGYLCLNSALTTITLPASANLLTGDIVRISGGGAGGWLAAVNAGQSILGNFTSLSDSLWVKANSASGNWRGLTASASGERMFAGNGTSVYRSDDAGANWTQTSIVGANWYALACSADGQTVYAAANPGTGTGTIQHSTDGGNTWNAVMGQHNWVSIACSSDGAKVIATATNNAVYVSTDSGSSSNKITSVLPTGSRWAAVTCSADGSRMAAALYAGDIYYSLNGGSSWTDSGQSGNWSAMVSSADGLHLVASTFSASGGKIYTSTDAGASWQLSGAPNAYWTCLAGSSDCGRIIAGINAYVLYSSSDFGGSWNAINTTNANWSCVACSADGTKAAAGISASSAAIYHTDIQSQFTTITNGSIGGGQGSAVELQYLGNSQFMPVSSAGGIWIK